MILSAKILNFASSPSTRIILRRLFYLLRHLSW